MKPWTNIWPVAARSSRSSAAKFGKQIRYADRRGIPFVWFPGDTDEVKDIRSGVQQPVDPDDWRPPDDDLRPRLVAIPTAEEHS